MTFQILRLGRSTRKVGVKCLNGLLCWMHSHFLSFDSIVFHAEQHAKRVPEDKIIASRRRVLKDKEMTKDHRTERGKKGSGERIIWSANDPNDFTFEVDGQEKTVAQYNMEKYGIRVEVSSCFLY